MAIQGMTAVRSIGGDADFGILCGSVGMPKSTVSEVLAGKKPFSRQMIRTLADFFHVDVSLLAANI